MRENIKKRSQDALNSLRLTLTSREYEAQPIKKIRLLYVTEVDKTSNKQLYAIAESNIFMKTIPVS